MLRSCCFPKNKNFSILENRNFEQLSMRGYGTLPENAFDKQTFIGYNIDRGCISSHK